MPGHPIENQMSESVPQTAPPPDDSDESRLKIYFLPNLLTAGNLFCGFVALTKIVEADPMSDAYYGQIKLALAFILLACIFDLFDGRAARWRRGKPVRARIRFAGGPDLVRRGAGVPGASHCVARRVCTTSGAGLVHRL